MKDAPPTILSHTDPAVRQVLVSVSVSASGRLVCQPAVLDVSGVNVLINFELQTAGWAFPPSQAVVVRDGGAQFPLPSWTVHAQQAALLDVDTEAGDFAYTVQVQHVVTGQRLSLDPSIRNQL